MWGPGFSIGGALPEPVHEERMHRTLDHTQGAARLLEGDFVSMIEENELLVPAAEQLYAALQEAEASATVLEVRLLWDVLARAEEETEHLTVD